MVFRRKIAEKTINMTLRAERNPSVVNAPTWLMSIFQTAIANMTLMSHAAINDTPDFFLNPTIKTMATAMGSADRTAIKINTSHDFTDK